MSAEASGLRAVFSSGRPAFVAYLMGGYPDLQTSLEAMRVLAETGADLIEVGVPYSDPIADGPVIVKAGAVARAAHAGGFGLAETFGLAARFVSDPGVVSPPAVVLMTYYNTVLRLGFAETAAAALRSGVSGLIIPDLPPDAAAPWLEASRGLDTVFLVAPTSTEERLRKVGAESSGFVYCVSSMGVTGERERFSEDLGALVERVRSATSLPVAVGFGVGTPEQAREVGRFADGVIVGSAIVRRQDDLAELRAFALDMAEAVHSAR